MVIHKETLHQSEQTVKVDILVLKVDCPDGGSEYVLLRRSQITGSIAL